MQRVPVNQKKLYWSFSLQLFKMHHVFQSKSGVNHVLTLTGKELRNKNKEKKYNFSNNKYKQWKLLSRNLKNTNVESTHLKKNTHLCHELGFAYQKLHKMTSEVQKLKTENELYPYRIKMLEELKKELEEDLHNKNEILSVATNDFCVQNTEIEKLNAKIKKLIIEHKELKGKGELLKGETEELHSNLVEKEHSLNCLPDAVCYRITGNCRNRAQLDDLKPGENKWS